LPPELAPVDEVFAVELGLNLLRSRPVDVLGIYLYQLDGIEHRYWKYREPRYFFHVSRDDVDRYGAAIDRIHEFYDLMLGDILDAVPANATVILLSDHGHGPVFGEFTRSGGHANGPPGVLVVAGNGVRPGADVEDATVYDIFPTILYLSGLPVEREGRGRVLLEVFNEEIRARACRFIDQYAPRSFEGVELRRESPVDREMIRRLRALGYVG
jgi:predicted AlkP superfamily phosphohydrolase/phosphomutase